MPKEQSGCLRKILCSSDHIRMTSFDEINENQKRDTVAEAVC